MNRSDVSSYPEEAEAKEVPVRSRFTGEERTMSFETFFARVREEINTCKLMLVNRRRMRPSEANSLFSLP